MEKLKYLCCCGFRKKQKTNFEDLRGPDVVSPPPETPTPVEKYDNDTEAATSTSSSSDLDDSPTTTIHDDIVIVED